MAASSKVDNRKPSSASKFQEAGYVMRIQPRERERERDRQLGGARGAGEEGRSLFLHPRERKKERERVWFAKRTFEGQLRKAQIVSPQFQHSGGRPDDRFAEPGGLRCSCDLCTSNFRAIYHDSVNKSER